MSLHGLRVPEEDGHVIVEPPPHEVGRLLEENRQAAIPGTCLGLPWAELREQTRRIAVDEARRYLGEPPHSGPGGFGGGPPKFPSCETILVAGHQPELFHPGVWLKNFVLAGLARRHGGLALNLIIDTDAIKSTSLQVPPGDVQTMPRPHPLPLPFDQWTGPVPWEERAVDDPQLLSSFPRRVAEVMGAWDIEPMVDEIWPTVQEVVARTNRLGEGFVAARRMLERRWGCNNLELPLSRLCTTPPFAWFTCHLLSELPRFVAIHNEELRSYRRAHRLRSHTHPVPELTTSGEWIEAPFWGWHQDNPARKRIFVRRVAERVEIRLGSSPADGGVEQVPSHHPQSAIQQLERSGLKLRPRALVTTLFARLFLGDLFLHGIGGGKYDQLTDAILGRFYSVRPPGYLIVSGTLRLPIPTRPATQEGRRQLARQLRDLRYNPQRRLPPGHPAESLAAEKRTWIHLEPANRAQRRERYNQLRRLTEELHRQVTAQEQELSMHLDNIDHQLAVNAVLRRRDYSFCMYPADLVKEFCISWLGR